MPRWINKWVPAAADEWPAVIWAFAWFFTLMASYMILRPIRESLGAGLGSQEINRLFVAVFLVMLAAVPIFGKLVSVVRRRVLIHLVFHGFTLNILLFALVALTQDVSNNPWMSRVYFVWVSVFNLFVVSLFWSVLADLFSSEQAKRLFGPIAAGATLGAICGSAFTALLSTRLGVGVLLLVAALILESGLIFASGLQHATRTWPIQQKERKPTGGIWAGVLILAKSPYLLLICLYLAATSICGATIYLQMADYVGQHIQDSAEKTRYFSVINLWVQSSTLILQLFVVGLIMRRASVAIALVILPIVYLICFLILGVWQSLLVFAVVDVLRRAFVYGISVPAREVLFTVVDREAKYKSKNFIDTVVFRGSDAVSSTLFVQLQKWLPVASAINFVLLPVAALWIAVGWWLGIMQSRMQASDSRD